MRRFHPQECDVYYYQETAGETDFVICRGNTVIQLVQVSYDISNPKTLKREIKGLLLASEKTKCKNLLLITNWDEKTVVIDDKTISIVPAYSCLVNKN